MNSYDMQFNNKIHDMVEESRFYEENDHCPTCDQEIDEELKSRKIKSVKNKAKEIQTAKDELQQKITEVKVNQQEVAQNLNKLRQKATKD